MKLFSVPYNFFVFCCFRSGVSGASAAAKGPGAQLVSRRAKVEVEETLNTSTRALGLKRCAAGTALLEVQLPLVPRGLDV